jgi:hypothetical protein
MGIKEDAAKQEGILSKIKRPFGLALTAGFVGLGVYAEAMTTGKEYGYGAGIAKGLLYSVPYITAASFVYEAGKGIGNAAFDHQKSKRQTSFAKPPGTPDLFGHMYTMRQRSAHNLSRGRSLVGQEARLLHY